MEAERAREAQVELARLQAAQARPVSEGSEVEASGRSSPDGRLAGSSSPS